MGTTDYESMPTKDICVMVCSCRSLMVGVGTLCIPVLNVCVERLACRGSPCCSTGQVILRVHVDQPSFLVQIDSQHLTAHVRIA